jgi:S-(hydroxymethyl)glutathione dehydrogenase/alcohol dehydrogenase
MNAVQGARIAGARHIVAVDPVATKRDRAKTFGANHTAASAHEALALVTELTLGRMADVCVVTVDVAEAHHVSEALSLVGKRGRVVMTAIPHPADTTVNMSLRDLIFYEKQVRGSLFGSSNPHDDVPKLLSLYCSGLLKLDELVDKDYRIEQLNEGYEDMLAGSNIRGLIRF